MIEGEHGVHKVHIGETSIPSILAAKLADRVSGEALSAREIEVLRKIAAGKANKEISAELFIGEGTVKAHVHRGLAALRAALVAAERREREEIPA